MVWPCRNENPCAIVIPQCNDEQEQQCFLKEHCCSCSIFFMLHISFIKNKKDVVQAMWIYPNTPSQPTFSPKTMRTSHEHIPAISPSPSTQTTPSDTTLSHEEPKATFLSPEAPRSMKRSAKKNRSYKATIIAYFIGMLVASILSGNSSGRIADFIHYYFDISIKIYQSKDWMLIFSTEFLGTFLQMTIAMVCGFCAFGAPLLVLLLFFKGIGAGLISGTLYITHHLQGVLINAVLFWVPEVFFSVVFIIFCAIARRSSKYLAGVCFESVTEEKSPIASKNLFLKYLIFCVISMIPCAFSAFLASVFSSIL